MKLGIIGCGIITQEAHIPALLRLKESIHVVALCNRSLPKAEKTAGLLGEPGLPLYTDWRDMIRRQKEMDSVLVSLPILLNYSVSRECVDAGLNVLCEKPAGRNPEEAELTLQLNREGGPFFMTAENFQYRPAVGQLLRMIQENSIGAVHSMQWNVMTHMPVENKYNQTTWRARNQYPGGYVLDGGVHFVHTLQQIAGPVVEVYGKTASINPLLGTTDLGFGLLTHASGVVSSLNMGWQHKVQEEGLKIFGTEGTLLLKDNEILHLPAQADARVYGLDEEDSFYLEWQDFYRVVTMKTPPQLKQEEVVRDVKVIDALLRSPHEGREIRI